MASNMIGVADWPLVQIKLEEKKEKKGKTSAWFAVRPSIRPFIGLFASLLSL